MKIRRVLIYEGPEADIARTLARSWVHVGENGRTPQVIGKLTIFEESCTVESKEDVEYRVERT